MTAPGTGIEPAYATALPAPQGGALPTSLEWGALERMAQTLADSDVIPYRLKRKPADVAVILLAAREYGIPPLMALSKLPVVNGTPAPMGELMVALVLRAGHRITARLHNPDGSLYKAGPIGREHYATCTTRRRDEAADEADELTFTVAEAEAAGLVSIEADGTLIARDSKGQPTPWELYPGNMLRWRAVANACRLRFPDVLLGLSYLPEELGAVVDAEGAPVRVVDAEPVRTAPPASLAIRTAQETADRAADENRPEVLGHVLEWAEANELLAIEVTGGGSRRPLRDYLEHRIEQAKAVVEAEVGPAPAPAASAPQPAADAEPVAQEPEAPAAPQEAAQPADVAANAELAGFVDEAARATAVPAVADVWRAAGKARLEQDVTELLEDGDARLLGLTEPVQLGAFLMAVKRRLEAGEPPLDPGPDAPAGEPEAWPDQPNTEPPL